MTAMKLNPIEQKTGGDAELRHKDAASDGPTMRAPLTMELLSEMALVKSFGGLVIFVDDEYCPAPAEDLTNAIR